MDNAFLGSIMIFAGNFAPRNWALCQGQILSIAQNTALFSILGTTYGGNGQTTFALPDLRGRVAVSQGQGPGLSFYDLGQAAGVENTTLLVTNMPMHSHAITINAANSAQTLTDLPGNGVPAGASGGPQVYAAQPDGATTMNAGMAVIQATGGSQPFSILQPYLTINYIICTSGLFPSRN